MKLLSAALTILLVSSPVAAQEHLPDAAQSMIAAAIANGDADDVEAVVDAARLAFPDHGEQIDAIWQSYQAEQAQLASDRAAAQQEAIRQANVFDNWSGRGEIGGFQASGNTDEFGITGSLALNRDGIDWEHRVRVSGDYRRTNGVTSREKLLARYEPRFEINEELFAYGLAQFDRNIQQGIAERYAVSGGLGYRLLDTDSMDLSVRAGPAYRVTEFVDGRSNSSVAGLLGVDFDWQLADSIKFTQDANSTVETGSEALVIVDNSTTTLNATTGLEANIIDALTARLAWSIEYDSNPPPGTVSTDTVSRFTLIYGF